MRQKIRSKIPAQPPIAGITEVELQLLNPRDLGSDAQFIHQRALDAKYWQGRNVLDSCLKSIAGNGLPKAAFSFNHCRLSLISLAAVFPFGWIAFRLKPIEAAANHAAPRKGSSLPANFRQNARAEIPDFGSRWSLRALTAMK